MREMHPSSASLDYCNLEGKVALSCEETSRFLALDVCAELANGSPYEVSRNPLPDYYRLVSLFKAFGFAPNIWN